MCVCIFTVIACPDRVTNGYVDPSCSLGHGSSCAYMCNQGFYPNPEHLSITCSDDGDWNYKNNFTVCISKYKKLCMLIWYVCVSKVSMRHKHFTENSYSILISTPNRTVSSKLLFLKETGKFYTKEKEFHTNLLGFLPFVYSAMFWFFVYNY